jgi:hypothetical protein
MMEISRMKAALHGLGFLCAAASLVGCAGPERGLQEYVEKMKREDPEFYAELERERIQRRLEATEVLGVSMTCFNHGDYGATNFAVEEVAHGQITRGMVGGPFGCGGVLALGYPVPLKWRPGLKVKVRWNTYTPGATDPTRHEKTTTILPYDRVGSVYVHFFPGDHVRVVIANNGATSPYHPIPPDSIVPPPDVE